MKVKPCGYRVLIRPDTVEEKTKSGIIIHQESINKEQKAQVLGTVIDVAEYAYHEYAIPWCKTGDRVLYQRYSGMRVPDGKGGFIEELLILNDQDVTAVVTEETTND